MERVVVTWLYGRGICMEDTNDEMGQVDIRLFRAGELTQDAVSDGDSC